MYFESLQDKEKIKWDLHIIFKEKIYKHNQKKEKKI